jgi:hypothetical protein
MVRLKTRWLLVRLDVAATLSIQQRKEKKKNHPGNISIAEDAMTNLFPPRKELATAIRQNIAAHLGIAGEGAALSTQGKETRNTMMLGDLRRIADNEQGYCGTE